MNVAFIVNLNLDDLGDLAGVAQEITDDLTQAGFEVKGVAPWARPALTQTGTIVPTQTQQPINPNTQI